MKKLYLLLSLALISCGSNVSSSIASSFESPSSIIEESLPSSSSSREEISTSSYSSLTSSSKEESSTVSSISEPSKYKFYQEEYLHRQVYLNSIGNIFSCLEHYQGENVTIAIIDGGFDIHHPDFKDENNNDKILDTSASFSLNNNKVDVKVGKENVNIVNGDSHGTFVASVAASRINGIGVVGIAPKANLMLLKVDHRPKSIISAIKYATDNNADILSISLGSYKDYEGD